MFGYGGKILYINLKTGKTNTESLREEFCEKYIGGVGFATRLLYDNNKPMINPYSPDNTLIFANGPFNGTMVPCGTKCSVVSKSPLTGFIGDAVTTSYWPRELKYAGYDALVIRGRADKPTYLFIDDAKVQLKDAKACWGKTPIETENLIREELGDNFIKVAAIGLAGEKLVRFAGICSDSERHHAGRTGLGAVMGSKNLKAVAIRGSKSVRVADLDQLKQICYDLYEKSQGPATEKYRTLGTPQNVLVLNRLGCLPTRNWQQATFEGAEKVSGESMLENFVTDVPGCAGCPIACEHFCTVKDGPYAGTQSGSIDYETLYALGPNCGVDYFPAIIKAATLCDHYGMDTMSTGVAISWAMECYERGLLTKVDTGGLELKFGNYEAYIQLIDRIASREGFGDLLSNGIKRASEQFGKGSEGFAIHIKGLELPGYDIRSLKTAALGWAVAARGGCHNRSGAYDFDISGAVDRLKAEKSRGNLAMESEDYAAIFDSLVLCKFIRRVFKDFYAEASKLYTLVTGFKMNSKELRKAGERIINLKKAFNIREGWTRKDDHLPPRVMRDPVPAGVGKGSLVTSAELNLMLDGYYEARGWTNDGLLSKQKLHELGLDDISEEMGV